MGCGRLGDVVLLSILCLIVGIQSESCKLVENTSDKCRSENTIKVNEQIIRKGDPETTRIKLPGDQKQVRWYCGSTEEFTKWNTPANQLRVLYQSDGSIRWSVYKCENLSGPKKAGLNCAVPETTEYCPKFEGVNGSACVFEMKKSTSHVNQKTTTVSVTGTLRVEVEKQAGPLTAKGSAEVTGGVSHSVTNAKIVSYESRYFLVIPPGYSFCAFTNNTSVRDINAPTGFRWKCSFPSYVQAAEKFNNGRCSSLEICAVGVCGRTAGSGTDSVHSSAIVLMVFSIIAIMNCAV